jgi:hypothetical protein
MPSHVLFVPTAGRRPRRSQAAVTFSVFCAVLRDVEGHVEQEGKLEDMAKADQAPYEREMETCVLKGD